MKYWHLTNVERAIESIPECSIIQVTPGEDYTTEQFTVKVDKSDHFIYIRGFKTDGAPIKYNEIEMIEVTTGYSDGDMPNDPDYCVTHAKVKGSIMRLGYLVVNSLEPYF